MTNKEKETLLAKQMEILGISREEAEELMAYDYEVDHSTGGLEFDLDKATEKAVMKEAHKGTERKETNYNFKTRERKVNDTKVELINAIYSCLTQFNEPFCENVEISNQERQILFNVGENKYELTLIQKRKPKS